MLVSPSRQPGSEAGRLEIWTGHAGLVVKGPWHYWICAEALFVLDCATLPKAVIYAAGVVGRRESWGSIRETYHGPELWLFYVFTSIDESPPRRD